MTVRFVPNPHHRPAPHFGAAQQEAFDPVEAARSRALLRQLATYRETPLHDCAGLAQRFGVHKVWIKDEGERKPLKSFKSLGGAFALGEWLRQQLTTPGEEATGYAQLLEDDYKRRASRYTVVAATEGSHGHSVAWGASLFGANCCIYLPSTVSFEREQAIRAFGAGVVRVSGNLDSAVERARSDALREGWLFLQDTSTPQDTEHHRVIMRGYSLIAEEIASQLEGDRPTHAFLQVGFGGMAASVTAHLWTAWGSQLPRIVLVQSERADSVVRSFETGRHAVVAVSQDTVMTGLACGEVAHLCWPLLEPAVFGAMAIDDASAVTAMRMAADTRYCPRPIIVGQAGGAGLAALSVAAQDASLRERLGLERDSRVLLINSEGDTNQVRYRELMERGGAPQTAKKTN